MLLHASRLDNNAGSVHVGFWLTGSVELSVVLCDDAYITELNQEWRGKAAATDVLSFPATDWDDLIPDTPLALGDIIISLDTAHRQACEQG